MMNRFRAPILWTMLPALLCGALTSGCAGKRMRPMSEMQGGCSDFRIDLRAELDAANKPAKPVMTRLTAEDAPKVTPELRFLKATLNPASEVELVVGAPDRGRPPFPYAGFISLSVPDSGTYRISAASYVWIEVLTQRGKKVKATAFAMQSKCDKILKTGAYALSAGTPYTLELSDGPSESVLVMITPAT